MKRQGTPVAGVPCLCVKHGLRVILAVVVHIVPADEVGQGQRFV